FVTPREERHLRLIMSVSKAAIKRGKLPSREDVMAARFNTLKEKINEFVNDKSFDRFLKLAGQIAEEMEPMDALAALLKFQLQGIGSPEAASRDEASLDDTGASPGMARLFMTIGKEQGVKAGDIVNAIAEKAKISRNAIRGVSIFDTFTFVEVPRDAAAKVIEFMHQSIISGRKVAVAPARPRDGMSGARR
ncbi:MAG: DbpA RNA binding domain-containing protein, partial [Deltaproteobacteria bacterium]|nr:DbpA RNA binding domain-containing protein [Deltaproteobacteria bacterium]